MHIVVVDGSRTGLMIMQRLIEPRGDEITFFLDGRDALDFIRSTPDVEIVITSFELASLSGAELCWEVRVLADNGRPIYVIAMSANTDAEHVIGVLDAGADDFMSKPPRVDELSARLRVAERTLKMQHKLVRLATIDELSGLLNRRAFLERAEAVRETTPAGGTFSLILFDVDHFKRINDVFGHSAGDSVIQRIGQLKLPPDCLSGRIGGEEFAVVLPDVPPDGAVAVAEHMREQLAGVPVPAASGDVHVTASFGVASLQDGDILLDVMRRADSALYHAKNSGRNRVSSFTPSLS